MAAQSEPTSSRRTRQPPATSPEAREQQLIALAVNVAEEQMRNGTASAQVITHYLKLGTSREELEQKRLQAEVELAQARVAQLTQGSRMEELTSEALRAFRSYTGQDEEQGYDAY